MTECRGMFEPHANQRGSDMVIAEHALDVSAPTPIECPTAAPPCSGKSVGPAILDHADPAGAAA